MELFIQSQTGLGLFQTRTLGFFSPVFKFKSSLQHCRGRKQFIVVPQIQISPQVNQTAVHNSQAHV